MKTITQKQWDDTPENYKAIRGRQHYIFEPVNEAACSVPVRIKDETDETEETEEKE